MFFVLEFVPSESSTLLLQNFHALLFVYWFFFFLFNKIQMLFQGYEDESQKLLGHSI